MNKNRQLTKAAFIVLTILALSGVFEQQAFVFTKQAAEKNMHYLGLIEELKLIVGGISSVKIPFISGHSDQIIQSLDKAQDFLFKSEMVLFIQLLLLALSRSILIKAGVLVLLILTFIESTRRLSTKFLVMALAISPGLSLFVIVVQLITASTSIDFGDTYLQKINDEISAIKQEKTTLMQEHAGNLNQIYNGKKRVDEFVRLKEDVAYDFQREALNIKGKYEHVRLLIHNAGHDILSNVTKFCATVLFCFLLLPFGYLGVVYIFYRSQSFNLNREMILEEESKLRDGLKRISQQRGLWQKFRVVLAVFKRAFNAAIEEIKHSQIEQSVKKEIEKVASEEKVNVENEFNKLSSSIADNVEDTIGKGKVSIEHIVQEVRQRMASAVRTEKEHLLEDATTAIDQTEKGVKDDLNRVADRAKVLKDNLENKAEKHMQSAGHQASQIISDGDRVVRHETEEVQSKWQESRNMIEKEEHKVKDRFEQLKDHLSSGSGNSKERPHSPLVSM